ncbi:MAG: DUF3149 domain-containing protein [Bacteroidetes bacterium]|nr:DUF3149 domain-containing protein [Bacteroidota bacterium]MCH8941415.1 DUF3149 domain-containing protein [Bacteroidota bacterium]
MNIYPTLLIFIGILFLIGIGVMFISYISYRIKKQKKYRGI